MEENKTVCCPKTRVRLEAIKRNEVEGLEVVDNIIGKSVRKNMENQCKKYNIKLQFLYASDIDGWFDDKTRIMYIALDHAVKVPATICFERELRDNTLQVRPTEKALPSLKKTLMQALITIICVFAAAILLAIALSDEYEFGYLPYVGFALWILLSVLGVLEFFIYDESQLPIKLKKKEGSLSPVLGTMNNCGGIMSFSRIDLNSGFGIYYNYIAILGLPIIFVGTYLAKEVETHTWRRKSYKVLGQIYTPWREIYHFYILSYGTLAFICLVVYGIWKLGTVIGFW